VGFGNRLGIRRMVLTWGLGAGPSAAAVRQARALVQCLVVKAGYHHAFAVCSHLLVWERIAYEKKI